MTKREQMLKAVADQKARAQVSIESCPPPEPAPPKPPREKHPNDKLRARATRLESGRIQGPVVHNDYAADDPRSQHRADDGRHRQRLVVRRDHRVDDGIGHLVLLPALTTRTYPSSTARIHRSARSRTVLWSTSLLLPSPPAQAFGPMA